MSTLKASAATALVACHFSTTRPPFPATSTLKLSRKVSPNSSRLRYKSSEGLQIRRIYLPVLASNPNSSGNNSVKERAGGSTDGAEGPPLLTILAGFIVFAIVLWGIFSVVTWLIGFVISLSPK